jgi:hypothetical protein
VGKYRVGGWMGRLGFSAICPHRSSGTEAFVRLSMERRCKEIMTTGRSSKPRSINQKSEEVAELVRQSALRRKKQRKSKDRGVRKEYVRIRGNILRIPVLAEDTKAIDNHGYRIYC